MHMVHVHVYFTMILSSGFYIKETLTTKLLENTFLPYVAFVQRKLFYRLIKRSRILTTVCF